VTGCQIKKENNDGIQFENGSRREIQVEKKKKRQRKSLSLSTTVLALCHLSNVVLKRNPKHPSLPPWFYLHESRLLHHVGVARIMAAYIVDASMTGSRDSRSVHARQAGHTLIRL
jgi:hypothetical protein